MTPTEKKTLQALAQSGDWITKKELATKTGIPRRSLYLAVKTLLDKGFVATSPSLEDTRQSFFYITDFGRQIAKEV